MVSASSATRRRASTVSSARRSRRDRDERRGHDAAGGIRRVGHQLAELGRFGRLHLDQVGLGDGGVDLVEDVGGVVGIDLFENVGRLGDRHPAQDPGRIVLVQAGEQIGQGFVAEDGEEDGEFLGLQVFEQRQGVVFQHPGGAEARARRVARGYGLPDVGKQILSALR